MADASVAGRKRLRARVDKLGVLVALIVAAGLALPIATFRESRIVLGDSVALLAALPLLPALLLACVLVAAGLVLLASIPPVIRLGASLAGLGALTLGIGAAGTYLTPEENPFARVSPGAGFWLLLFAFALALADAATRIRLSPLGRLAALGLAALAAWAVLAGGIWDTLSVMREYEGRADAFWREAQRHVFLAFGSLGAAALVGLPLGIVARRSPRLRGPLLNVLNIVQTIPSIALFGLLIAPLGWIAANVPGASAIGIAGIGAAPALVALFFYSLLPVVGNTLAGLDAVPPAARDAATGMGMTEAQRLARVELPLALPVILTGIRIVLVQNIGLATIAGLIGGGGFGVFVFQGLGQTAMDLVLLGALPTVALAFAAGLTLDAMVEMLERPRTREGRA